MGEGKEDEGISAAERRIQQIWMAVCGVDLEEDREDHWLEVNQVNANEGLLFKLELLSLLLPLLCSFFSDLNRISILHFLSSSLSLPLSSSLTSSLPLSLFLPLFFFPSPLPFLPLLPPHLFLFLSSEGKKLRIGSVTMLVKEAQETELVPHGVDPVYEGSQEMIRHLRWLMQKDQLLQDVFLIG